MNKITLLSSAEMAERENRRWRRERRIRMVPSAVLLDDLANQDKADKHHRIRCELVRRHVHPRQTVRTLSGKILTVRRVREDGYIYYRESVTGIPISADALDFPAMTGSPRRELISAAELAGRVEAVLAMTLGQRRSWLHKAKKSTSPADREMLEIYRRRRAEIKRQQRTEATRRFRAKQQQEERKK